MQWGRANPLFNSGNLQLLSVNNNEDYVSQLVIGKKTIIIEEVEYDYNWVGSGKVDLTNWDFWKAFLVLVRGQGKEVEFKTGPSNETLSLYLSASFSLKDKYGDNPSEDIKLSGGMRLYAITRPYFPEALDQADFEDLQKVHLVDFSIQYAKNTTKTSVSAVEETKNYENIDALIKSDIPFYGLYFKPLWGTDYYLVANISSLSLHYVLNTDSTNHTSAQGSIMNWKPGYGYSPELSITAGVWYEEWPDLPEYFFKLWRGFTFEMKFRSNPNVLDDPFVGLEWQAWNFKDGRYCRNFSFHFETSDIDNQGDKINGLFFYIGNSTTVRATLSNGSWHTLRLVLLGVDRLKRIYDGDDISIWDEGELIGFTEEANLEYFKDVHDSKVHFKGLPTFSSYAAIYIDNNLIWTGTMDSILRTGLSDYGLEYMDYAKMALILDGKQENSWYFDYVKMTDKAMDVQSGFDVEHKVLES